MEYKSECRGDSDNDSEESLLVDFRKKGGNLFCSTALGFELALVSVDGSLLFRSSMRAAVDFVSNPFTVREFVISNALCDASMAESMSRSLHSSNERVN